MSALVAAVIRGMCAFLGMGSNYEGQVLGDEQFKWLETVLSETNADVNIMISSIQFLTSNPVVESWGK